MKNTEKNLDEIIFEKRNKAYGAYALRKSYSKNLIRAMIIAFTIFLMGVSIPLIASYMKEGRTVVIDPIFDPMTPPPIDKPIIKPPDPPKQKVERVPVFSPPIVTTNPDSVSSDLSDLADKAKNRSVFDTNSRIDDIPDDPHKTDVMDDPTETTKFTIVEEMPKFPGGDEARIKFLAENIKYPQVAREIGVQGSVYLNFTVEKDGSITDVKMLRGIGAGCDEEAARVISMMPKWNPGRQNGKAVRVEFNMPIAFVLK